jgi:DTW domain-containing protein YfiP
MDEFPFGESVDADLLGGERPRRVCWCAFVADPPIAVASRVLILQHPAEARRAIRTALMAVRGVAGGRCRVVAGRKFHDARQVWDGETLGDVFARDTTYLLYPGPGAVDVAALDPSRGPYTLVVLDGTWDEAKKLFSRNPALRRLSRAALAPEARSSYVVRTQPADLCLSTVETVAQALAALEGRPEIVDALLAPLHALCNVQINHGAVGHDSKEFKGQNGRFVKQCNRRRKKQNVVVAS